MSIKMKKRSNSKRNRNRRSLRIESLENRNLLAADLFLHNQAMPEDVNGDQYVSPMDALAIINQLNATGYSASLGEGEAGAPSMFLDVNGDSQVSPIDALSVINTLNAGAIKAAPVTPTTPAAPATPTADVEQEGQFGDQNGPEDASETESTEDDAPVIPGAPIAPATTATTKTAPATNATPNTPTVPAVSVTPTGTNTDDNDDRVGEEHHIDNAGESSETKLVAVLPGIAEEMAYVEFEMESERGSSRTELGISVNFLEPRSLLDVVIDGVLIGQISTDADGHGDLDLSSHPRGSHEIPLPADFPIITSGTSIQIGTSLSGTFSVPATPTTDSAYSPTPTNRWAMSPWQWEAYHGRRSW
jgi:hypothetical protein